MDLKKALTLETPRVEIPWGITEAAFRKLVHERSFERVTEGHLRIRGARFLGGIELPLTFIFTGGGHLRRVEMLRDPDGQLLQYHKLQARLESALGPSEPAPSDDLHPLVAPTRWRFGRVTVTHSFRRSGALREMLVFEAR